MKEKVKTRYPLRDNGFYWSCYPDLNRRPHPYQGIFDIFITISAYFQWFLFRARSFPELLQSAPSVVSRPVCGGNVVNLRFAQKIVI